MKQNRNAQSEAADILAEWRAVYAEIFPHRNPEAMPVDDPQLALAVMVRRELRLAAGSVSNLRTRTLDRLAKHNPLDQE